MLVLAIVTELAVAVLVEPADGHGEEGRRKGTGKERAGGAAFESRGGRRAEARDATRGAKRMR